VTLLERLVAGQREGKPMMMVSPQRVASSTVQAVTARVTGLHLRHTYAVIGVDGEGRKVKLYNPWGFDHPNGDGWVAIDDAQAFFEALIA
jgi:hypothetical protein